MILNSQIFTATIEAAKAKAANRPEVLRAIDCAVVEIQKASYWSFPDGVLTIKSTTSGEIYRVDSAHTCPAHSKTCKHNIARLLMIRYSERLAAAPVVTEADERAAAIAKIETAWLPKYTVHQIGAGLLKRFGVNQLEMVSTPYLKQLAALIQ